jgi:S-formylglutathione hydrolase
VAIEPFKRWRSFGGWQEVYRHPSEATGTPMELSVFRPPEPRAVLVFLSGLTCTWENVTTKGGFQRAAADLGLVVVCPDTSPRGEDVADDPAYDLGQGAAFYVDATRTPWSAHFAMERYVVDEVPRVLRDLGIDTARMGITGHSMGGHGALTLGLRHPERFASISAFAPIVAPSRVPWGRKAFAAYLGDDETTWLEHDACALVGARPHPAEILVDQGEADEFLDRQLQPQRFTIAAQAAGQAVRLRLHADYDHSYYTIATFMDDHLRHHATVLLDGA